MKWSVFTKDWRWFRYSISDRSKYSFRVEINLENSFSRSFSLGEAGEATSNLWGFTLDGFRFKRFVDFEKPSPFAWISSHFHKMGSQKRRLSFILVWTGRLPPPRITQLQSGASVLRISLILSIQLWLGILLLVMLPCWGHAKMLLNLGWTACLWPTNQLWILRPCLSPSPLSTWALSGAGVPDLGPTHMTQV